MKKNNYKKILPALALATGLCASLDFDAKAAAGLFNLSEAGSHVIAEGGSSCANGSCATNSCSGDKDKDHKKSEGKADDKKAAKNTTDSKKK